MNRPSIIFVLSLATIATVSSCGVGKKLPPCYAINARIWASCEVSQSTVERGAAGLPASCVIPFAATKCVETSGGGTVNANGVTEFLSAVFKFQAKYSAPGGWPPFVTVGDNVYWLKCPVQATDGTGLDYVTNGQPGNPWPSLPVVDLDAATPDAPGLNPQGPGGPGGGLGGASSQGGDCAICLGAAPCDGLTTDQCATMHCSAVCPYDSASPGVCQDLPPVVYGGTACVGPGGSCGSGGACCANYFCYPSDVGSVCM